MSIFFFLQEVESPDICVQMYRVKVKKKKNKSEKEVLNTWKIYLNTVTKYLHFITFHLWCSGEVISTSCLGTERERRGSGAGSGARGGGVGEVRAVLLFILEQNILSILHLVSMEAKIV